MSTHTTPPSWPSRLFRSPICPRSTPEGDTSRTSTSFTTLEQPLDDHPGPPIPARPDGETTAGVGHTSSCTAPQCPDPADLRVSVTRLLGPVVLVDHAAEYLPALHGHVQWYDGRLGMIGWPLAPGLVRPVPVIVPLIGPQHRPQMMLAIDQHPVSALGPYRPYPAFCMTVR